MMPLQPRQCPECGGCGEVPAYEPTGDAILGSRPCPFCGGSGNGNRDMGWAALAHEAIDAIESWAAYAGDYFQQKHDLEGEVADYRARLALLAKTAGVPDPGIPQQEAKA